MLQVQSSTMTEKKLFITNMPASRPADYYLGYFEGSVFIDFNNYRDGRVCLRRISFDGYGCYNLGENPIPLSPDDSRLFKDLYHNKLNNQDMLLIIVKKAVTLNKQAISEDALIEYELA